MQAGETSTLSGSVAHNLLIMAIMNELSMLHTYLYYVHLYLAHGVIMFAAMKIDTIKIKGNAR